MDKYEQFCTWLAGIAKPICDKYGLPTSVCIAQAAIESGWGEHNTGAHNIFGMTKDGVVGHWREYSSYQDAIEDYCRNIKNSGYYDKALTVVGDQDSYIDNLAPVYEPLNSNYALDIKATIRANGLSVYDSKDLKPIPVVPKPGENTGTSGGTVNKTNDPRGILSFARFAESMAFRDLMVKGFEQGMDYTLHTYLATFMQKFYHNMYYVPTLPNNKVILVKPETMFINPPSCNIIYPTLKSSLSFVRNPKQEPTRVIMITDPVTNVFNVHSGALSQLVTMAFIEEDEVTSKDGTKTTTQKVVGLKEMGNKQKPVVNLTKFEKKNGVRILRTNQGEDLYLFLVSNQGKKDVEGKKATVITATDAAGIAQTLYELSSYALLRNRYESRQGSTQTYFNPYIVPGFPMLSIEGGETSSLNVYAYVTDVTHQITDRAWTTHIGFTGTHIQTEPRPNAFPIIENEYVKTIDTTYKNMLGDAVTTVTNPSTCREAYNSSDTSVSSMLKKVWRPLTTREQHLSDVCDGATLMEGNGYKWLRNGSAKFFDENIQNIVKGYTENIMTGTAFNEMDVR